MNYIATHSESTSKKYDVDSPSWVVKKTVASLTTAGSDRHQEKIIPSQSSTSSPLKSYNKGRPKLEENANLPYFVAPFFTVKNCCLLKRGGTKNRVPPLKSLAF